MVHPWGQLLNVSDSNHIRRKLGITIIIYYPFGYAHSLPWACRLWQVFYLLLTIYYLLYLSHKLIEDCRVGRSLRDKLPRNDTCEPGHPLRECVSTHPTRQINSQPLGRNIMASLYNRFWVITTALLCLAFVALFFPPASRRYGAGLATLLASTGVLFIWIIYLIRAYIFSRR